MMRLIAVGLWMCLATLASSFGAVYYLTHKPAGAGEAASLGGLDYERLRPINVPILEDGALRGYVVAQLVFTADRDALQDVQVPPHPFIVDEAFRLLYADETLNFRRLERYDLDRMKARVRETVNARIGSDLIQEILVEEFNYFAKEDVVSH
ncbi:hypothetical protein GWI72_13850 [Microvirga tunisiensis]|uniref:Uncharacterized protein n=2 Tax=Pannonibacter tanglangensis TaxID=2750084 RepID=A0A7X5F428_9HYPH|nr:MULTISPECIES: hypothetical protein [unclassified Pannonibacter]NBN64853.1 hypothetical protein [Pannonibacter sp. XCT-34]NBN79356.1 hypothetical protein [Pannonibacter sp. XCT-53]